MTPITNGARLNASGMASRTRSSPRRTRAGVRLIVGLAGRWTAAASSPMTVRAAPTATNSSGGTRVAIDRLQWRWRMARSCGPRPRRPSTDVHRRTPRTDDRPAAESYNAQASHRSKGAHSAWPATRSPSSAPATSAPRPRSGSPRPGWPTSCSSTSSRASRRARASISPRRRPVVGHDARITGTNDYADTAGSDIVVVTSGLARQPGMSRDDLLAKNAGIVRAVVEQAAQHSPDAILIIVTNPLDAMCHVALDGLRLPARARPRDGRRARFGALPHVHRRGARRLGRGHPRLRPRRPRRHDGAAAALLDGRRRADHGAA